MNQKKKNLLFKRNVLESSILHMVGQKKSTNSIVFLGLPMRKRKGNRPDLRTTTNKTNNR